MKKLFTIWLYVLAGGTLGVSLLSGPLQHTAAHAATPKGKSRVHELEGELALAQAELATCNEALEAAVAARSELTAQVQGLQTELAKCLARNCLPDTGQTKCYDQNGTEIPCDSATCPGQDGFYATGCPPEGRFVDNQNGTVMDNCTGLVWQKDTADVPATYWCNAVDYCADLNFAGHDDWRLPNVRELQSIVDYGRVPAIDPIFGTFAPAYWSSTSHANVPAGAWLVDSGGGSVIYDGKGRNAYVRAVRSGP
jgi:hypothetical protein